jgi:hypothetical protein
MTAAQHRFARASSQLGLAPRPNGSPDQPALSDPGLQDCVHNVVHTGLGDRTCPLPYLCCTLLVCEVGLVGTEGNYSSCTRVQFLG